MSFSINADFPGGNIVIDSVDGDTIRLQPDLRDTTYPWFYWYFSVTGAAGRRLTFVFEPQKIGVRGPAVSLDGGRNWRWLGADSVVGGSFTFFFPEGATEVRFSVGMPYVRADWDRFIAAHVASPYLRLRTLTRSAQGRDVPLLFAGSLDPEAPFCVALTARHHACEMMPSYLMEGVIEAVLADDGAGAWLRNNVSFLIVPFMDADGVERGDQGKNRAPHDHNRDYSSAPIYPEVRAFKERLPAWLNGRALVGIDIHDPALSGPVHESIFFLEPEDRIQAARLDQLSDSLWRVRRGSIVVENPNKLAFGVGFNTTPTSSKQTCAAWMSQLPEAYLGVSLEIAYASAWGSEVNAESARELGHDLARALADWLSEQS